MLTRTEMEKIIRAGGSVMLGGRIITRIAELPAVEKPEVIKQAVSSTTSAPTPVEPEVEAEAGTPDTTVSPPLAEKKTTRKRKGK